MENHNIRYYSTNIVVFYDTITVQYNFMKNFIFGTLSNKFYFTQKSFQIHSSLKRKTMKIIDIYYIQPLPTKYSVVNNGVFVDNLSEKL